MVFIVGTIWAPPNKAENVAKKYLEITKKYPVDESIAKVVIDGAIRATKEGIKSLIVWEVVKGKFNEAMSRAGKILAEYRNIEGFRYEIETMLSPIEALPMIGMSTS